MEFATVRKSKTKNLLVVTVLKDTLTDEELECFLEEMRDKYPRMSKGFVLAFDLTRMGRPTLYQCTSFIKLFHDFTDFTSKNLKCTCIVYDSDLVEWGIRMFRSMYNPIRPMHTCRDRDAWNRQARELASPL